MNFLRFEADEISGMDQLRDQFPVVPDDPTDDPLYGQVGKRALDYNRYPARVEEDAFIKAVSSGDVETEFVDEFTGLPAKLQKGLAPVDPEDVAEIELNPALEARIHAIAAKVADSLQHSLGKAMRSQPSSRFEQQPLQKRAFKAAPSFGECTCAAEGRKCLACREKNVSRIVENGNSRIIFWENGETYETV